MKQNLLRTAGFMLACCVMLAGCSTGGSSTTATSDKSPQPSAPGSAAPKKEVTLTFMHWFSYVTDDVIKEFEKQNPGIKVDNQYVVFGDPYWVKLKGLANTNSLPDVVAIGGVNEGTTDMVEQGKILDLKDAMQTPAYDSGESWISTQSEVLIQNLNDTLDRDIKNESFKPRSGHQWALPFGAISLAVIYNKNIFEKVGISEPKTFDEFLENNDKLRAAGYIPLAHAQKDWDGWWLTTFLDQTARDISTTDYTEGKVAVDDPRVKEAYTIWEDMIKRKHFDKGVVSAGIDDAQALFVQQKAAQFYIVPENFAKYLAENVPQGVKVGAFALPGAKGLPSRSIGGSSNRLAVSAKSEHPEEAIKLLKFLTSNTIFQMLAKENVVPSLKDYQPPAGDAIMAAYAKAYENGFAQGHSAPFSKDVFNSAEVSAGLLLGELTVDDVMKKLRESWAKEPNNPNNKK